MKTIVKLGAWRRPRRPILLAAGFFDGVHRGHQAVIRRARAAAARGAGATWVLTFDPHPRRVIAPDTAPALLNSGAHKLRLLAQLGVQGCVVAPFTPAAARREPEVFIAGLKRALPGLRRLFVGANWTFGRGGRGDTALLRRLGARLGFRVTVIPPVRWRRRPISSTRIRRAVRAGRLADAAHMLGRPFSLLGVVRRGRQIGRRLGFPTANLDYQNEIHPPPGVYYVRAALGRELRPAVANLGYRPTFGGRPARRPALELHLLQARPGANLYGRTMEVFFLRRCRAERRFKHPAALRAQIARDLAAARRFFRLPG